MRVPQIHIYREKTIPWYLSLRGYLTYFASTWGLVPHWNLNSKQITLHINGQYKVTCYSQDWVSYVFVCKHGHWSALIAGLWLPWFASIRDGWRSCPSGRCRCRSGIYLETISSSIMGISMGFLQCHSIEIILKTTKDAKGWTGLNEWAISHIFDTVSTIKLKIFTTSLLNF